MKISIITVCWNSEKFLKFSIESILAQTYKNIEYIIIDGGSTDSTLDIIRSYEPYFNGKLIWISERDHGIYDAMNKGIALATGEVIGILNSDDFYSSNLSLEKVMSVFKGNNIDSLYADLYYVDENDVEKIVRKWETKERKAFAKGWHPAHPAFFVKKVIYKKFGNFDLNYKIASDFEIMLRFLDKNNISSFYLKDFILKMRLGGESNKSFSNIRKGKREVIDAFKKHQISISFFYPYKRWLNKIFQYF